MFSLELEPEVELWLRKLDSDSFGQAAFYLDLLAERGVRLGFPYTSQLAGRLRELRFYIGRERWRLTYFMVRGERIILLTVFRKTHPREVREVARARRAMQRCIAEGHVAEEDDDDGLEGSPGGAHQ